MSGHKADDKKSRHSARSRKRRRFSKTRRVCKWLLSILLIVVVLLGVFVGWVVGTRSGLEFAWHYARGVLPAGIAVADVSGRLIGPLHLEGVHVDNASMTANVANIDLSWDAAALLGLELHVNRLAISGVDYTAKPGAKEQPKPENEPFSLPDSIELPASAQIDELVVDDVSIKSAPEAEPFKVAQARLGDARFDNEAWRIGTLTGHGPLFRLEASSRVVPKNGYPTELSVDAKLNLPDLAPIDARASISGKLADLDIAANVAAPYNVSLNGTVKNALDTPKVDLQLGVDQLKARAVRSSLPPVTASVDAGVAGPIDDLAIRAQAGADSPQYGKANLDARLHYSPQAVLIRKLVLSSPEAAGQLSANGRFALAGDDPLDLKLSWSDLQWPLKGAAKYKTAGGNLRLAGALDDYRLNGSLSWQVVGQTAGKLTLVGSGTQQSFDLNKLAIRGGPGDIDGRAKTRWAPSLDASVHLTGAHINPAAAGAGVAGNFDFELDASASQKGQQLQAVVNKLSANGRLRGQPLALDAKARYAGQHVVVDTFSLKSGPTTASLSGRFGWQPNEPLDGQFAIDSSDLSTLAPSLAGSLHAQGQIGGRFAAPVVAAKLSGDDLGYQSYKLAQARINADVAWTNNKRSTLSVELANIDAAGQQINSVTVDADGTPGDHRIRINVDGASEKLGLATNGQWQPQQKRWRFTLTQLDLAYGKLAPWRLAGTASGAVTASEQNLNNACLRSGNARLCLAASHDPKASTASIKLSDLAFDYVKPFMPETLAATGALSGSVEARVPSGGQPRVAVDLDTTASRIATQTPDGKPVTVLSLAPGDIRVNLVDGGLDANFDLPLAGSGGINARASVAPGAGSMLTRPLSGRLRIQIAQLSFIEKLSPQIGAFEGSIDGDIGVAGSIAKPRVQGRLTLDAPRAVLVAPGLTLTDMRLAAVGRGDSVAINADVHSGGGQIRADGAVGVNPAGQSVAMTIKGQDFQAINIPDVTAYISPDLKLNVSPQRVDVNGSVTIPKASITPRNLPSSGVTTVSSDQVIVGQENTAAQTAQRVVHAKIDIILGENVSIDGFGLQTSLDGRLQVVQQPNQPAVGSGRINLVNGSFKAYGQNLDIRDGQILFGGGPLSSPAIDLTAARYPRDDITVGVHVRGPAQNPKVTLFSEPSMTQTAQLSWLLLGRGPGENSAGQSSLLARAALALGSGRANSVLNKLGNSLGVDQIGIGSGAGESSGEAALTVGKYLTPKLLLSYGLGLFNGVSTVSLAYTLNSNWTLKTESSTEGTGGDIIYSIDR